MNMYYTTKAAFFTQARLQPQELALQTILRIELSPYTLSDRHILFEGSRPESHRKRVLFAHLGFISSFFKTHRHLKVSRLDWKLPIEIECKLAQLLGFERSSNCTCIQGQPNNLCDTGIATCNSRCEVKLIDALTFEVNVWSLLPPFPRHGEHTAEDVRALFHEKHQRWLDSHEIPNMDPWRVHPA
jgi:hypothetical protein